MAASERILLIETSGRGGFAALAQGETLLATAELAADRQHARDLAPLVAGLLREAGWAAQQVQAVVVSRGPGSFTSLRVGVMSAKAFAYAVGCTLLAVDTFDCYAHQCPPEWSAVEVIGDAQQRRVQVQRYQRSEPTTFSASEPASFTATEPIRIVPIEAWLSQRPAHVPVTGPALALVRDRLPSETPIAPPAQCVVMPGTLLKLGLARLRRGESDSVWALEPLYAQLSSAEEKQARSNPASAP